LRKEQPTICSRTELRERAGAKGGVPALLMLRTSENSVTAKFAEFHFYEVG
jgi:hypothetical protein